MTEEVTTNGSNNNNNNDNNDLLSKEDREKKVIDLYFIKRKPVHYIAKKLRMSLTTIVDITKRYKKEKSNGNGKKTTTITPTKEKEAEDSLYDIDDNGNDDARVRAKLRPEMQQQKHQITSSSPSLSLPAAELEDLSDKQKAAMAYKLYDQGRTPVQVATTLCLTAREAESYYQDFWKIKRQYQLYQIYPEIQPYLPSFLKLFKELKRQGLTPNNVKWFVDGLNMGTIKIEDVYADFENVKANNQNLKNEHQNLTYENQSLRGENQDIVNGIQYNRRMFENDSKAMKEHIAELVRLQEQQQQNIDTLSERILGLANQKQSLEEFVYRFRSTNQKYLRIKGTAQEIVSRFWSQALKEPDKKMALSILLSSLLEAIRENPDRYDIIFNNDNDSSTNNNAQKQNAVLEVSAKLSKALIENLVNETMNTLESQADTESEAEAENTELGATEDIEHTDKEEAVETESKDIEAAAAEEEEETKPEE